MTTSFSLLPTNRPAPATAPSTGPAERWAELENPRRRIEAMPTGETTAATAPDGSPVPARPAPARPGVRRASAALEGGAHRLFNGVVDVVMRLLVPLAVVALMMGVARTFLDLWAVWRSASIATGFDVLVTDILSMFVVVELLKSVFEYFEAHRLKLTFILDAALVFLLREAMIGLYKHTLAAGEIAALGALLAVLGALRVGAVLFSPAAADAARAGP